MKFKSKSLLQLSNQTLLVHRRVKGGINSKTNNKKKLNTYISYLLSFFLLFIFIFFYIYLFKNLLLS